MSVENIMYENYMFVRDLYTIFKITGFIFIIIGLIVYIKLSINNLKEEISEVKESLESQNTKQG